MSFVSDAPGFESDLAGGAPWETAPNSTAARHGSAIWHMKNVKTPVLILHGENDVRCPLSNAVAFHRGCLHYGVDCEFVVYPREGHNIAERQHRVDVLNRLRRFIDLHLSAWLESIGIVGQRRLMNAFVIWKIARENGRLQLWLFQYCTT